MNRFQVDVIQEFERHFPDAVPGTNPEPGATAPSGSEAIWVSAKPSWVNSPIG
jgi:hypothetical protein